MITRNVILLLRKDQTEKTPALGVMLVIFLSFPLSLRLFISHSLFVPPQFLDARLKSQPDSYSTKPSTERIPFPVDRAVSIRNTFLRFVTRRHNNIGVSELSVGYGKILSR
jgi:hypothetical protein